MAFYDFTKEERKKRVASIQEALCIDFTENTQKYLLAYFSDEDTYIRKAAYLGVGRLYLANLSLHPKILKSLEALYLNTDYKVRQTVINSAGEIGKSDFEIVKPFFDKALFDAHHAVRNAVIGSVKKMGEKNPKPVLQWANTYMTHPDKEIRRELCHGIELRGRTHPEDILPLLKQLQFDQTSRVKNTLIHVLGQIAYKKGCLPTVVTALNSWNNAELVQKAVDEIVDVHRRYKNFSHLTQEEAITYIDSHYKGHL